MSVFRIWIVANFSVVRNAYFEIPNARPPVHAGHNVYEGRY